MTQSSEEYRIDGKLMLRFLVPIDMSRTKTDVSRANFVDAYFSKGYLHGKPWPHALQGSCVAPRPQTVQFILEQTVNSMELISPTLL